jgi:hypothetical protein
MRAQMTPPETDKASRESKAGTAAAHPLSHVTLIMAIPRVRTT